MIGIRACVHGADCAKGKYPLENYLQVRWKNGRALVGFDEMSVFLLPFSFFSIGIAIM